MLLSQIQLNRSHAEVCLFFFSPLQHKFQKQLGTGRPHSEKEVLQLEEKTALEDGEKHSASERQTAPMQQHGLCSHMHRVEPQHGTGLQEATPGTCRQL